MKATISLTVLTFAWALLLPPPVNAQRGTGATVGVARQAVAPLVIQVSGTLREIKVGPCEHTSGRSRIGTHLLVDTVEDVRVNVHLGPADAVDAYVSQLHLDEPIMVDAFETPKLPEGHRIAQKVTQAGATFVLRDESLRPVWAPGNRAVDQVTVEYGPRPVAQVNYYRGYYTCPQAYRGPYRYSAGYGYRYGYPAGYGVGRRGGYGYRYGPRGYGVYYRGRY